jgi:hypothetical protein
MGHPMSANLEYVFFAVAHALRVSRKHERGKLRNLTIHTAYALKIPIDPAYFGISQSGLVKILKKKPLEAEILPVLRVLGDSRISARL